MAWFAFVYFSYERLGCLSTTNSPLRFLAGIVAAVFALLTAVESLLISSPWLTQVAGIGIVVAWLLIRGSNLNGRAAVGLTSLLWITLPLPAGYDDKMIQYLQGQSSRAASAMLDCIGILHLPEGNVLELTSKKLFVDEACSGVDSLYALMAICLTIVLWLRQRLPVAIVSLSLVPVWASCGNIARLVTIVLGLEWLDIDLSHGTPHTVLGMIVFACAFMCDFAFIRFAGALLGGSNKKIRERRPDHVASLVLSPGWRKLGYAMCLLLVSCFAVVGLYSTKALSTSSLMRFPHFSQETLATIKQMQNLPPQLGEWQFDSFQVVERNRESAFGQFSNVWTYRAPEGPVTISADFPFRGFHLLDICYEGAGWKLLNPSRQIELLRSMGADGQALPFYAHVMEMKNDEANFAYVAYTLFELSGKPIRSAAGGVRGLERFEQTVVEPISYQIQIMLSSSDPINDQTKLALQMQLGVVEGLLNESFQFLDRVEKPK